MIVTTGNEVEGYKIAQYLCVVSGVVVRSPNVGQQVGGGLAQAVGLGGNIKAYTQMCEQARFEASTLMVQQAERLGADAIIGMRFDATNFAPNITEVFAYGTAVKIQAVDPSLL